MQIQKENISLSQLFTLLLNFLLGSAIVIGSGNNAKNDAWLANFVAAFLGLGIICFYYLLLKRMPGKNLFEIFTSCFGRKVSIALSFLYIIYFFYISSRVVRDFCELMASAIMPNTPIEVISLTFCLLMGYVIYLGIEVLARTSEIFTPYLFGFFSLLTIFLMTSGEVNFLQLQPFLSDGIKPIMKAVFPGIATFPFGELIAFTVILPNVTNTKYLLRTAMIGVGAASFFLIVSSILMVCTLGVDTMLRSNFPLLSVARNVSIGNFIERIDAFVVFIMMLNLFVKGSIFFFAGLKGLEHIFQIPFRYFAIPIAMVISFYSVLVSVDFANHLEEGTKFVPYFLHLPFQFYIPFAVFVLLFWKQRKNMQKQLR
ncbi:endospore germination permease [Bacillota bacterium Lsc_1132]